MNRRLKITFITLLIVLLALISFVGLFMQDTKFMKNILPEYQLGMDLKGHRAITIGASNDTKTVYYDADGNEVSEETEGGTSEEVPVNSEEALTKENYEKTKQIIEARLKDLAISEYLIRLNDNDGTITVNVPENNMTDIAAQFLYSTGKFTIEDEDGQVLMDNSNLEKVQVGYTTSTSGATIYLSFTFNKDSVEKLKEITNTYVESTDEDGNDTTKKVSINVDDSQLIETSFDEEIANGILQLTLGTSTDNSTINSYIEQGTNIAILLNNGSLPITYTVEQNRFIKSDLSLSDAFIPAIVLGAILLIGFIFLIVKYKKLGLLAMISYVGYMAILLIVIRYTNLVITMEGIFAILISAILNYILLIYVLQALKKADKNRAEYKNVLNKSMLSMLLVLIPTMVIGIAMCFASWLPVYSFGTIIFWGVFIIMIYNALITRILFVNSIKEEQV